MKPENVSPIPSSVWALKMFRHSFWATNCWKEKIRLSEQNSIWSAELPANNLYKNKKDGWIVRPSFFVLLKRLDRMEYPGFLSDDVEMYNNKILCIRQDKTQFLVVFPKQRLQNERRTFIIVQETDRVHSKGD